MVQLNDRTRGIEDDGKFLGEFYSTWQEDANNMHQCFLAKLVISLGAGSTDICNLKWDVLNDGEISHSFWGQALVAEGMLIGNYQDSRIQFIAM